MSRNLRNRNRWGSQRLGNPPPQRPRPSQAIIDVWRTTNVVDFDPHAVEPQSAQVGVDPAARDGESTFLAMIRRYRQEQQDLVSLIDGLHRAAALERLQNNPPIAAAQRDRRQFIENAPMRDYSLRGIAMDAISREMARRIDDEIMGSLFNTDVNRVHDSFIVASTPERQDGRQAFNDFYQQVRRQAAEMATPQYAARATQTGRISSSEPAFQSLPARGGIRSREMISFGGGTLRYGDWVGQVSDFVISVNPAPEPESDRLAAIRADIGFAVDYETISAAFGMVGASMRSAAEAVKTIGEALNPKMHPDAGKLVVPPRKILRSFVGFAIEAIRAPNGGVDLRPESNSIEINFKRTRFRIKRSTL